jgi:hypothetical protein
MRTGKPFQVQLEPPVRDFLTQHGIEAKFQSFCEVVREFFPEANGSLAWLQDDPDEEGRAWVVLEIVLPASYPLELLHAQRVRSSEEICNRLPGQENPAFSLSVGFSPETV